MVRQNRPALAISRVPRAEQELPVGSELLIAVTLGMGGWWLIVQMIRWIAG